MRVWMRKWKWIRVGWFRLWSHSHRESMVYSRRTEQNTSPGPFSAVFLMKNYIGLVLFVSSSVCCRCDCRCDCGHILKQLKNMGDRFIGLLMEFYVLVTSNVISRWVLTCDSAHSWQVYGVLTAPLGNHYKRYNKISHSVPLSWHWTNQSLPYPTTSHARKRQGVWLLTMTRTVHHRDHPCCHLLSLLTSKGQHSSGFIMD